VTKKKALIWAAAAVVVLGAVAAAPQLIDWNSRKGELADRAEAALGRQVSIEGPLSLSLLPTPHLSAKDVRLANLEGASAPEMAKLAELDLRLKLWPLLRGRIEVASLTLVSPEIHLERLADGRVNWQFKTPAKVAGAAPPSTEPPPPPKAPAATFQRIDKLSIKDGTVFYDAPGGTALKVEGIDASFSGGVSGPYRAEGSARAEGVDLHWNAKLGQLDGPPSPLSLSFEAGSLGELQLTGQANQAGFSAHLAGRLTPVSLFLPVTVEAELSGVGGQITADQLSLGLGPLQATGSAQATLAGGRVSEAGLDVKLADLAIKGGTISQGRLNLALSNGEITVNQASATLPGQTDVNLFGFVAAKDGAPTFDGTVELGAADGQALLAWAGFDPGPIGPLSLSGGLLATPASARLDTAELRIKGATLRGVTADAGWSHGMLTLRELSASDLAGAQFALSGGIGHDRIEALRFVLRTKHPDALLRLAGAEGGERLGPLALTGSLDGPRDALTLDSRLEAGGGLMNVSGKVAYPAAAPTHAELSIEASHGSLAQLIQLAAPGYRPTGNIGAFAAQTRLTADGQGLALADLRLHLGPTSLTGEAKLSLTGRPRLDVSLSGGEVTIDPFLPAKHAAALREVDHKTELPATPVAEHRGVASRLSDPPPLAAAPRPSVRLVAETENWSHEPIDLAWMRGFDATLSLDARAVSWSKTRLDQPSLALSLGNGTAILERFAAGLWGGKLTVAGQLDADGHAAVKSGLAAAQMGEALLGLADLDIAKGVMEGDASLSSTGHSEAELIGKLKGNSRFKVGNGVIHGFDLKAVDDKLKGATDALGLLNLLQAGLSGGNTQFSELSGTVKVNDGIATTDDLRLIAEGGSAGGQGTVNLPDRVMDSHVDFRLASAPEAPPLVMHLSGPLDHPHKVLDVNALQSWLVERAGGAKVLRDKAKDFLKGLLGGKG